MNHPAAPGQRMEPLYSPEKSTPMDRRGMRCVVMNVPRCQATQVVHAVNMDVNTAKSTRMLVSLNACGWFLRLFDAKSPLLACLDDWHVPHLIGVVRVELLRGELQVEGYSRAASYLDEELALSRWRYFHA